VNGASLNFNTLVAPFEFVTIPNTPRLEDIQEASYTISAWIRPEADTSTAIHAIFVKSGNFGNEGLWWRNGMVTMERRLRVPDTFDLSGYLHTAVVATGPVLAGEWHHVVGVVDVSGRNVRVYVDGAAQGVVAWNNLSTIVAEEHGAAPWRIGCAATNPGILTVMPVPADPFVGHIDDVRIYS
jgi:hypothetical protein